MYDLVIRGATVVDGLGHDPRSADVAVKDGRIAAIGEIGAVVLDPSLGIGERLLFVVGVGEHAEFEAALLRDRSVRDAAVLGVADTRLGEIPVALVETTAAPEAVLEQVADRLAPYKRPRRVFVVERLPRVPNGKVDRPAASALAATLAATASS